MTSMPHDRQSRRHALAEHLYAVMIAETMGRRPGADAPHLSFALLPEDVKHGWLAVADAARTMAR